MDSLDSDRASLDAGLALDHAQESAPGLEVDLGLAYVQEEESALDQASDHVQASDLVLALPTADYRVLQSTTQLQRAAGQQNLIRNSILSAAQHGLE